MKLWEVAALDKAKANEIAERFQLPPIVAALLQIRGVTSDEDIQNFLYNDSEIDDPLMIKDMDKACQRVSEAIEQGEFVCVYGDYDADGVTSTVLLYSYLTAQGANVTYYIPERLSEGYGMNMAAVEKLAKNGVQLIITVDNGISSKREIAYAKSLGMDTVVTDHHTPPGELPDCCAVVDLHQSDCNSRFKEISGVGVAFKLIMALEGENCNADFLLDEYADLLSIGTVADIVDLREENRVFVKRGIECIMNTEREGLRALIHEARIEGRELTATDIGFFIGPRINAAGRLSTADKAVELLLTNNESRAVQLARELCYYNNERKNNQNRILAEIDARVRKNPSLVSGRVIVIAGDNWHKGVIGIVSARIKEIYGKPAIIISRDGEVASGSGRSIDGFALNEAVAACSDLLTKYGGHPAAVGLSLKRENINLFRKRINDYAENLGVMPFDKIDIDLKLKPEAVSLELIDSLSVLEPFGENNRTPVFLFSEMRVADISSFGKDNSHLKVTFEKNGARLVAKLFSASASTFSYVHGDTVDLAARLEVNDFLGNRSIELRLEAIKASRDNPLEIMRSGRDYNDFINGAKISPERLRALYPDRSEFALVYRYLRGFKTYQYPVETLVGRLDYKLPLGKIKVILQALKELRLLEMSEGLSGCVIKTVNTNQKSDLNTAPVIRRLKEGI